MIRLSRSGITPPARWGAKVATAIPQIFAHRAKLFEELPINAPERRSGFRSHSPEALPIIAGRHDFKPLWRTEKYVKTNIGAMSGSHCAYCQSPVGADQHGEVEHFKPKLLFPAAAYDWGNYFLSCQQCNNYKGDKWPAAGTYLRPDEGDPASRLVFFEDGSVSGGPRDADAKQTIESFGLDRSGLSYFRRQTIERSLHGAKNILAMVNLSREEKKLLFSDRLAPDLFPYSVAINQNLRRLWAEAFAGDEL
ncbi:MAG: hypothetical protein HC897_04660 [Thermoanaerobaculia bacterium]|nr:hypothetical protein [Thermoanaerobaculia bacterium]